MKTELRKGGMRNFYREHIANNLNKYLVTYENI